MMNILGPDITGPPRSRAPAGKFGPPAWLFPGYNLARVSNDRPDQVESRRQWIRQRARQIYPGAEPIRCRVNWYSEVHSSTVSGTSGSSLLSRSLAKQIDIPLE